MTDFKPLVTYHMNTFNRKQYVKNLFESFKACNVYENFEWVVTDYGSTDGTQDYLFDLSKNDKRINLIFNNEKNYIDKLQNLGLKPQVKHQMVGAIFGKAINEARSIANGEYYIHVADDHQFFRKGNWVEEMLNVFKHRENVTGKCDISSVLYRSLPLYRLYKQNNETFPEEKISESVSYFVAKHKHYDDYHMMKKKTYEDIGPCFEIHKEDRVDILENWKNVTGPVFNHYADYLIRAKEKGYVKVFLKYPWVVDLDGKKNRVPIVDNEVFIKKFSSLNRPVSSNDIFGMTNT